MQKADPDDQNCTGKECDEDAANQVRPRDEALIADLHAIGLRSAALFEPGLSAVDHGDLLYDERGLPK